MKSLFFASLLMAFLSGCVRHDPGSVVWFDVYGHYCGRGAPHPGCDYYLDGYKVHDQLDPYYYSDYQLSFRIWSYRDVYGGSHTFTGWAWMSPDGVLYDRGGHALNAATGEDTGRDLIAQEAEQESAVVRGAARDFAGRYALSEAAGLRIARALNEWSRLGKSRERTEADLDDFSHRLLGVGAGRVQKAIETGDTRELSGEVATCWGTTPETARTVLESWYQRALLSR